MGDTNDSGLLPQHAALIKASAISDAVAAARGYRSVTNRSDLERLGFTKPQRNVPCLLIPIHNVHGEIATYQIRPDQPRIGKSGKPIKYETPNKSRMVLDVPSAARACLGDLTRPLYITEGIRKADAAVSLGLCCVGLLGVWNWRGSNADGGKTALPDWESIALNDRDVYIVFDSDAFSKAEVRAALPRLRDFLNSREAHVKVVALPAREGGTKVGLDDYLAAGHGVDDLHALVTEQRLAPNTASGDWRTYEATDRGLVYHKEVAGGVVTVRLTNFVAKIITEFYTDDGVEAELSFELEGHLRGRAYRFTVPAKQFHGMGWVVEKLGASAVVFAGQALRDHTRAAIQLLSEDIRKRAVYSHVGWRRVDGASVYLHVGGAIGQNGAISGIEVVPPDGLGRFTLPDPPCDSDLRQAIRASLDLLNLAPYRISVPLLAAIYRAVIGKVDFSLHLVGPTGEGKTALAVLAQQHFGSSHSPDHLPGSWLSTGNALEALAFAAKDAVLVIDDFVPKGSATDVQRMHREAERLFRAQGNSSGRQRMRADATLRPVKPPRGLILSTGEDIPRGQSLRARVLILEVGPGDLNWDVLTSVQHAAGNGLCSQALSGFIRWLAVRIDELEHRLRSEVRALRDRAHASGQHRRTAFIVANLALGMDYFLAFAKESGAISDSELAGFRADAWAALGEASVAQRKHLEAEEPTRRFFELLAAAIASGRAHVASPTGGQPNDPTRWGWRSAREPGPDSFWQPFGDRVGWVDGGNLYLEPEASYTAAQKQAREGGDNLPVSARTLHKRLHEGGHLVSVETTRDTLKVRRSLEGARRDVLHLRAASLLRGKPDQPDQDLEEERPETAAAWSGSWSGSEAGPDQPGGKPDQPSSSESAADPGDPLMGASVGRVGRVPGERDERHEGRGFHTREVFEA